MVTSPVDSLVEVAAPVVPEAVVSAPVEVAAPVVPEAAVSTPVQSSVLAPVQVAVASASNRDQLLANLSSAGLTWVETDQGKWDQVQRLLQDTPQAIRIARVRKPLIALSTEPLVQVETRSASQQTTQGGGGSLQSH
jgi:ribonuclease E